MLSSFLTFAPSLTWGSANRSTSKVGAVEKQAVAEKQNAAGLRTKVWDWSPWKPFTKTFENVFHCFLFFFRAERVSRGVAMSVVIYYESMWQIWGETVIGLNFKKNVDASGFFCSSFTLTTPPPASGVVIRQTALKTNHLSWRRTSQDNIRRHRWQAFQTLQKARIFVNVRQIDSWMQNIQKSCWLRASFSAVDAFLEVVLDSCIYIKCLLGPTLMLQTARISQTPKRSLKAKGKIRKHQPVDGLFLLLRVFYAPWLPEGRGEIFRWFFFLAVLGVDWRHCCSWKGVSFSKRCDFDTVLATPLIIEYPCYVFFQCQNWWNSKYCFFTGLIVRALLDCSVFACMTFGHVADVFSRNCTFMWFSSICWRLCLVGAARKVSLTTLMLSVAQFE